MEASSICKALAHPLRRSLLLQLEGGECDVSNMARTCQVSQPSVSKHLAVLREAGLVTVRADGKRRCYTLTDRRVLDLIHLLGQVAAETSLAPQSLQSTV